MDIFLQNMLQGFMNGGVYALIALGIVLIYKSTRVLNIAQGQFLVVGAWIAFTFSSKIGLNIWLSFFLTLVAAIIIGFLIERFTFRPLIGQPISALITMTIVLMAGIEGLVLWIWGGWVETFPDFIPREPIRMGNIVLSQQLLWMFIIAMVFIGGFALFFKYTRTGLAMRATAEDHQVAQSVGISVKTVFGQTWAIAALIGAIGGIILGSLYGVSYQLGEWGLKVLTVAIIGGLDSIPGAIVAGLMLGLLEKVATGYVDPIIGGGLEAVFPFVILLIVLMIKPYGLFGLKEIERI
ncbi:MAG: branched-chain amino acid ABC transporter permease [Dehalococcoidia bacterium]|nr:branched-chain amino acid ABC transporter permease [Dehalococcoidia bacterium]MDZ4245892.1 branched-chain amino acid ABC transporter permease [Dehalococcoidia bacterium]